MGKALKNSNIIKYNDLPYKSSYEWVTYAILIGFVIEFMYHRNIPLLAILTNTNLSYHEFGIPTFHVILVTFNSFFSIVLFHSLLSKKTNRKNLIILFVLTLIPSILIMNRGMLMMIIMSCIFVYLIKYENKINIKKISLLSILLVVGLYFFGVAGNVRVNNTYQTNTSPFDNSLFLNIGGATEDFRNSIVPKEFFWAYIYISSPLANLQQTIDHYEHEEDLTLSDSAIFGITQLFPDFISKRVVSLYDIEIPNVHQITPELNVSTAFAQSYVILGWVGVSLFIVLIFIFALFYIILLKKINSEYFVVGLAILNTIFIFNAFTNMFSFTGLSFQLIYPVIFSLFKLQKNVGAIGRK